MRILILRSVDSQYVRIVGVPEPITLEDADKAVARIIQNVKAEHPDDWSWELIEDQLKSWGFPLPEWRHGPYWDEE